jgi:ketosteroid isomerase-like protein
MKPRSNPRLAEAARRFVLPASLALSSLPVLAQPDLAALQKQVFEAERAFARSMAERRHDDFVRHLSEHAIFFGGGAQVLRGKAAVAAGWKAYYDAPQAPFSWEPDVVEVVADGQLAHSTGIVRDPAGKPIARFNSVWRQEAPGVWRVVIDKGQPLTEADRRGP